MSNRDGQYQRDYMRKYRAEHPEYMRGYRETNRDHLAEQDRRRHKSQHEQDRQAVLAHYGPLCACCGSTDRLCIDHVNGDGAQHRMTLFGSARRTYSSARFYRWLVANGFPDDPPLQTLCLPCNNSKRAGLRCRLIH